MLQNAVGDHMLRPNPLAQFTALPRFPSWV